MLILLPPSETKRPGGRARPLDVGSLALPALAPQREACIDALVALSHDADEAVRVLKLSAAQRPEIADNAAIRSAPTMAAIERYTGVLYDALDAASVDAPGRRWMRDHVLIHSAPFGPVGAMDAIPAYRLAAGISLPGLPSLRKLWSASVTEALATTSARFVLDLRSEAYVSLGPVPPTVDQVYVRVVSRDGAGVTRALNHFNKHAKGELVRSLALARPRVGSLRALRSWAETAGWELRDGATGEINLVV